jgi:hypothetical protein
MVAFIDQHKGTYGVEPICRVLPIATSTYFKRKAEERDPRRRPRLAQQDAMLRAIIQRIWNENHQVYGPCNNTVVNEPEWEGKRSAAGVCSVNSCDNFAAASIGLAPKRPSHPRRAIGVGSQVPMSDDAVYSQLTERPRHASPRSIDHGGESYGWFFSILLGPPA